MGGGLAVQWRRTASQGALALGLVYLFFALRHVPRLFVTPLSYDPWGNIFEQLSLVAGAVVVFAGASPEASWAPRVSQAGRYLFGICVISFTLEQLVYLEATASFVPKWIPPGAMFWAIATTVAMALAAVAILTGQLAVLASRLLTAMCMSFGLLIWVPRLVSTPHDHMVWGANAQNLAITGAAWIVSDLLARTHRGRTHEGAFAQTPPL